MMISIKPKQLPIHVSAKDFPKLIVSQAIQVEWDPESMVGIPHVSHIAIIHQPLSGAPHQSLFLIGWHH